MRTFAAPRTTGRDVGLGSRSNDGNYRGTIAGECEHVTLLQRSPTYFFPAENRSEFADELRRIGVSDELVHELARKKALFDQDETCQRQASRLG